VVVVSDAHEEVSYHQARLQQHLHIYYDTAMQDGKIFQLFLAHHNFSILRFQNQVACWMSTEFDVLSVLLQLPYIYAAYLCSVVLKA